MKARSILVLAVACTSCIGGAGMISAASSDPVADLSRPAIRKGKRKAASFDLNQRQKRKQQRRANQGRRRK